MINVKELLLKENRDESTNHGCLMAMFPKSVGDKITNFGKKIIGDKQLYIEGSEFGRETDGHVTIRYGFTKDLNELEIRRLLAGQKPFLVELYGLDQFKGQPNELNGNATKPYDVIYLKAKSDVLDKLNEATKVFPHKDSYSEYHPHVTVAYVQRGTFPHIKEGLNLRVLVDTICYSPISGEKSYFSLKNEKLNEVYKGPIPRYLYHATFGKLLPGIENVGLVPGGKGVRTFPWSDSNGVYLMGDKQGAVDLVENGSEDDEVPEEWLDDVVVLTIDLHKIDNKKLFEKDPQWHVSTLGGPKSFMYRGIIPWSAIVKIEDSSGKLVTETRIIDPAASLATGDITLYHGTTLETALKAKRGELGPIPINLLVARVLTKHFGESPKAAHDYFEKYADYRKGMPNVLWLTPNLEQAKQYAVSNTKWGGEVITDVLYRYIAEKFGVKRGTREAYKWVEENRTKDPAVVTITVPLSMVFTHPHWVTPARKRILNIVRNMRASRYSEEDREEILGNFGEVFVYENIPAKYIQRIDRV